MVVWWVTSLAAAQTCPDRDVLLHEVRTAVQREAFDEARAHSDDLVEAFDCGPRAQSAQLVGLWLGLAAIRDHEGKLDEANDALKSAHRLGDAFDDRYGPALKQRWHDAGAAPILPSRLAISASSPAWPVLLVDGLRIEPPALIEAGLHLVQWGATAEEVAGARIVRTRPDGTTTLVLPEGAPPVVAKAPAPKEPKPPEPKEPKPPREPKPPKEPKVARAPAEPPPEPSSPFDPIARRPRSPVFLVVAGVAGVGALVTAGLTASGGPSANAPGVDVQSTLASRFDRQRALGLTSFGLMAASTVSIGLHVAL